MINFVVGSIILIVCGGLGMYLDIKSDVTNPPLYWFLGLVGGIALTLGVVL